MPPPRSAAPRPQGRGDAGVAAVEFALVAPLFFVLVLGTMVYGIYFATWIAVTQIASDSARAAIAGLSTGEQNTIANATFNAEIAAFAPLLSSTRASISTSVPVAGRFAVTVSYDFSSFGFASLTLLPVPATRPSVTVTVSNGA